MKLFEQNRLFFENEGYAIIDDIFPIQDLIDFRNALRRTIQAVMVQIKSLGGEYCDLEVNEDIEQGLTVLKKINSKHVSFVQRVISRSPEFLRLSSNLNAARAVRFFLNLDDESPLYLLSNGIVFTFPNDPSRKTINFELDWHKDIFFTIPRSQYVHIWVPVLHDANVEIGTLHLAPGSHKEGIGKMKINPNADYNYRYIMDPEAIENVEAKAIEVKLGQALFFDYRMMHRSGLNTSDKIRCTMLGLVHNVCTPNFEPVATHYTYEAESPEAYFATIFNDEKAYEVATINNDDSQEPKGGV